MNKFERRQFFERLCQLRALYRLRSEWDSTSQVSIVDAISYATHLLDEARPDGEAVGMTAGNAPTAGSAPTPNR